MLTPEALWNSLALDLEGRKTQGLFRSLIASEALGPTRSIRGGKELLHFASNDYLAMAWHPQVRQEYSKIAAKTGVGSSASPLILGASDAYFRLVESLARWHQSESAIVFPSGYAANLGTLGALATSEDLILSDSLNHACLIDGCRLSKATVKVYPHRDIDTLSSLLANHRNSFRMAYIVTDTVFSMDGDIAPIQAIESLLREHQAIGIADEAHGAGVLGSQGQGVLDSAGADRSLWVKTGTLSKAIGCSGGYVVGTKLLCETLLHRARSLIFSTALPPALLAAASKSIEILQTMDNQRDQLALLAHKLRQELTQRGFRTTNDQTPIVPIYVQNPHEAVAVSSKLLQAGIYVPAIRPPTVPPDGCMLRISLSAAHTQQDCQSLLNAMGNN